MLVRIEGNKVVRVTSSKAIAKAESRHIVPRSGMKRLGYTQKQRSQLREIITELKD
ncbi:MAG TPA: hypothetical protein VFM18_11100 [Methanosarcina sp.]|nr:hypothetical protein [Methanosarcina sp.]